MDEKEWSLWHGGMSDTEHFNIWWIQCVLDREFRAAWFTFCLKNG